MLGFYYTHNAMSFKARLGRAFGPQCKAAALSTKNTDATKFLGKLDQERSIPIGGVWTNSIAESFHVSAVLLRQKPTCFNALPAQQRPEKEASGIMCYTLTSVLGGSESRCSAGYQMMRMKVHRERKVRAK